MKLGPWQKILLYFNERLYIFFGSSVSGKHVLAQPTIIINKYQCHHTADWIWWVSKKHWISTGWRIFSVRFDPTYSRRYTETRNQFFQAIVRKISFLEPIVASSFFSCLQARSPWIPISMIVFLVQFVFCLVAGIIGADSIYKGDNSNPAVFDLFKGTCILR